MSSYKKKMHPFRKSNKPIGEKMQCISIYGHKPSLSLTLVKNEVDILYSNTAVKFVAAFPNRNVIFLASKTRTVRAYKSNMGIIKVTCIQIMLQYCTLF